MCMVHGRTGTRNSIFGYPESSEKWVEGKLNKAFLFFSQIFAIFDDLFKFCSTFGMHHFEKSSKNLEMKKKPCSTCAPFKPFPHSTAGTQNPVTQFSGTRSATM